jgi:hypothetical protein
VHTHPRASPTPSGLTLGFTIWTTAEDICEVPGDSPPEKVIWLDPPEPGEVGCISVVFIHRIGEVVRLRGYGPIASIPVRGTTSDPREADDCCPSAAGSGC